VAEVAWAPRAAEDLDRLDDASPGAGLFISGAIRLLADHPLIGRAVDDDGSCRELVISRGKTGYLALYRFDELQEQVIVAAIRHQRESGFDRE
jgi:plasmid stabilization system protein ParE